MEPLILTTKEQLNIYMNPQRQKIMRLMRLSVEPCTPKELADKIGISASAIQHHLAKLATLGLVYVDHTAIINGITAKYYMINDKTVHIGMNRDDGISDEREVLLKNHVDCILDSALLKIRHSDTNGDVLSGIVHLSLEKSYELYGLINEFITENSKPSEKTAPWEYAIIAYRAEDYK